MRRILFFSFHYPPDQSAGALRSQALVHELHRQDSDLQITVFCSTPRRYGVTSHDFKSQGFPDSRIRIWRFWIPFLGQGPAASVLSYCFYFVQAIPAAISVRPQIIVGTSAKLLTSFVAACASRLTGAQLFIDFRDTFADNFFYFYRWNKRILFQSLIMAIENIVLRSARSINVVSPGFREAFVGWDKILSKYNISLTNFPNGISSGFRQRLEKASSENLPGDDIYRIAYAGNLGEGQDILGLLDDLAMRPDLQERMRKARIQLQIYGSGSQSSSVEALVNEGDQPGLLSGLVVYCGLLSRDEVEHVYSRVDCLMLQLGLYSSLGMVIPTKVFEYAATSCPILFGASGFTNKFIEQIDGTIAFKQCDFESFLGAAVAAREITISRKKRAIFLDQYDAQSIYVSYARHILGTDC